MVTKLSKVGHTYKIEFTGHVVGQHHIDLRYGGVAVPGSPFTCNLYDIKKIRLGDITANANANIGQPAAFTSQIMMLQLCFYSVI